MTGDEVEIVATVHTDRSAVVRVTGELTFETVGEAGPRLRAVCDAGCRHLVLDLSGVEFCDSSGLGLLCGLRADVEAGGGWLELRGARGQVHRLLDRTGILTLFVPPAAASSARPA